MFQEEPYFARRSDKERVLSAVFPRVSVMARAWVLLVAFSFALTGGVFFYTVNACAAAGDLVFDKPPVDIDWGAVQDPAQMLGSETPQTPAQRAAPVQRAQRVPAQNTTQVPAGNVPAAAVPDAALEAPAYAQPGTVPDATIEAPATIPAETVPEAVPGSSSASAQKKVVRLFGTVEFRGKLKDLPKWERVVKAYANRNGIDEDFGPARQREAQAWAQLKTRVAKSGDLEKAKAVNAFFNQWPYRLDRDTYGVPDYWATPREFIKNSGDCEDYAITKMYALKQLGVNPDNLRVIALKDNIRNLDHAVLAIYIGNTAYILDNVTKMVLTHDNFTHYRPYFSVNGIYKWTHIPPK
jgi:predicted transglutaminase-like cysteine proteinase